MISNVPAEVKSVERIIAVSSVESIKVVARLEPLNLTTEEETKLLP